MYQKFFTKTIESKFIKNLLKNTPLPIYKVIRDNDYIIEGNIYIYKERIIKATKSGIIKSGMYKILSFYNFGEDYPNYTERYISRYSYYDSDTHEFLGKYLRCLKGIYGLDLMPLYNCYSGRLSTNFYIAKTFYDEKYDPVIIPADPSKWTKEENYYYCILTFENGFQPGFLNEFKLATNNLIIGFELTEDKTALKIINDSIPKRDIVIELTHTMPIYSLINGPNTKYKMALIPIKLNQIYTIALDIDAEVLIRPAFIKNDRFVYTYLTDKNRVSLTDLLNQPITVLTNAHFNQPFTYKLTIDETNQYADLLEENENNLYLVVQLPILSTTSIVVLEGDYTVDGLCTHNYDKPTNSEEAVDLYNRVLRSKLSLLKLNDHNTYAFSDRLLEYLTGQAITPLDTISYNFIRANTGFYDVSHNAVDINGNYGSIDRVWTDELRRYYYNNLMKSVKIEHYDLLGYVDKEAEKHLLISDTLE